MDWFPTVESLANAPEERLLKAWEGLGYYSRVRNMQAAAQQIMADFGGQFPNTYEGISSLKGLALTQQEPFPVLLLTCLSQRLMAMSCVFWRVYLKSTTILGFQVIEKFFRQ